MRFAIYLVFCFGPWSISYTESKGTNLKRFRLELRQTFLACPGCGWLFDSTKLVIEHSAGTFTKNGPSMLVKQGGNRIGKIDWDISSIPSNASIKKATLWMKFNKAEGIANGDKSSVVKVYGWINNQKTLVKTLHAKKDIKDRGYNKVNNNVPFDYTDYVRNSITSSGESQGGAPASDAASEKGSPFSLDKVHWLHPRVDNWPATSNLDVKVHGPFIDLNFDKTREWKSHTIRHNSGTKDIQVNANPWVFVNQNGQWYAGTFEWMRPGSTRKHKKAVNGDHIKQPPLGSWSPVPGQVYYFMVSGLARGGYEGSHERTNIVGLKWPPAGGTAQAVPASQISPTIAGPGSRPSVPGAGIAANPGAGAGPSGPGAGGAGVPGATPGGAGPGGPGASGGGAQTLVITCKSSKVLGLFKKKRICGGELFSKLLSYRLVEQIGDKYICQEGSTFGVHAGHAIWVKGCKGRFEVSGVPKGQSSAPAFSGPNPNK